MARLKEFTLKEYKGKLEAFFGNNNKKYLGKRSFINRLIKHNEDNDDETETEELTVTFSPTELNAGDTVTFTATSNINGNVTSTSDFYINNVEIDGNTYEIPLESTEPINVKAINGGVESETLVILI